MRFLNLPEGYELCGNGCGQSYELENGDLLIPVYHKIKGQYNFCSLVLKCSFDGETLKLLEIGKPLTVEIERGLYEPSVIFHQGKFYLTMRNDEAGYVAESNDGLNYSDLQLWKWKDGSILQNYNTQQHWLKLGDELYLTYTRRGAENDHVFRHRAPIFISKVENMRLLPETERAIIPEKGARLGNFGCAPFKDGRGVVMAAEWMQPVGCEKMGSDNNIFISFIE